MITQSLLKELFDYNYNTGNLIWKITRTRVRKGDIAGNIQKKTKYVHIQINGMGYKGHNLVWIWVYGIKPKYQLDHINNDKSDNRIENLRESTQQQNSFNRLIGINNITGFKGIQKRGRLWRAQIKINGKTIHLGYFDNKIDAAKAYNDGAIYYYGRFARLNEFNSEVNFSNLFS